MERPLADIRRILYALASAALVQRQAPLPVGGGHHLVLSPHLFISSLTTIRRRHDFAAWTEAALRFCNPFSTE